MSRSLEYQLHVVHILSSKSMNGLKRAWAIFLKQIKNVVVEKAGVESQPNEVAKM
ncbi:hypothetical protein RchiOBHm_Chr5g0063521 [Rosa chinensis]|uniref:Uncharacterized protein n=1 Tax=Rosa chinensis TaxID=74649 RepID=A0A2P6QIF4_ROSCH|nr:hypothetical protein RchiOBHm_Chr5g0063521 [Rosa chinensis]